MKPIDLLYTGTGMCATGAHAAYTTAAGIKCGHERVFGPYGYGKALTKMRKRSCFRAESSWLAAPYLEEPELSETLVVHLVRHPARVMEAMSRVTVRSGRYWVYAMQWCPRLEEFGRSWTGFACRYVAWNRLIERKAANHRRICWKVDGADPRDLMRMLRDEYGLALEWDEENPMFDNRNINTHGLKRKHKPQYQFSLDQIYDGEVRWDLEKMAERYGYKL